MRVSQWLIITAVAVALPAAAAAQTQTTQTTQTTRTTQTAQPPSTTQPPTQPSPATQTPASTSMLGGGSSHWFASGFVGSDFGDNVDNASVNFGGNVGYLWHGWVGGELLANFSPNFSLDPGRRALLGGEEPWISTYMANAIGSVPLGAEGRWQPYVSGGVGAIMLNASTIVTGTPGNPSRIEPDDSRFAGNVGGGLMAFAGNIGIRGDVRWFRATEASLGDITGPESALTTPVLSQLQFWRANVGVAFQW
jgi:hypothetical protein